MTLTFTQATELYITNLRARGRSPNTVQWYREQFAAWATWRGSDDALPTADDIDAFLVAQRESGVSPATVHARFRSLRSVFNFLERRRHIKPDDNPMRIMDAPKVPMELRRYVTVDHFNDLVASIDGPTWLDMRDRLILYLLFYSGLRVGELCALRVNDLDTHALEIRIQSGKGGKGRVVPCTPEMPRLLLAYLYTRPTHSDILLMASDGYVGYVGALQREGVRQMLIRRCKRAGIPVYNPHAFRHGFAMWTLNGGVRLSTVSHLMGHCDVGLTSKVYAHTTVSAARREYDETLGRMRTSPPAASAD